METHSEQLSMEQSNLQRQVAREDEAFWRAQKMNLFCINAMQKKAALKAVEKRNQKG